MNRLEYLFTCLSEECNEVGKIASKSARFGPYDYHPKHEVTNNRLLALELNDLFAVIEMIVEEGIELPHLQDVLMIDQKKRKVERYLKLHLQDNAEPDEMVQAALAGKL